MKDIKNTLKYWNILIFCSLIQGCAIIPDLGEAPYPKTLGSYPSDVAFSTTNQGTWPNVRWWESYNDPQLTSLIEEALQNSNSIDQAEARIRLAEAVAQQTESALYPNIGANGSYTKLRQSYTLGIPVPEDFNDMAGATIDVRFQLDFWGRNRSLVAAAASNAEAVRLERQQTHLIVSTSVATAYANLAQLYANLDAAKDALTVRRKSSLLVKERQEYGLENIGSYEQEVAAAAGAEAEIEALKEAIALTKNRIALLVGAGPDRAFDISRPDIKKINPLGLPKNLPAELLGRRPDIIAVRLRAESAAHQIDAAKANFYPNVNLVGFAGHQAMGFDNFTSTDSLVASLGPAVTLPIFDGSLLEGQYRQSRAEYDATVAAYNATLQQAIHEVSDAVTSQKMLTPRLQKTEAALRASEKAYSVINNRYQGGLAAYLSVLRSEDALIASRRALADLRTRSFTLDIALIRALGGGFRNEQQL